MMKKQYIQPNVEIILVEEKDVITLSFVFDIEGSFDKKSDKEWEWK